MLHALINTCYAVSCELNWTVSNFTKMPKMHIRPQPDTESISVTYSYILYLYHICISKSIRIKEIKRFLKNIFENWWGNCYLTVVTVMWLCSSLLQQCEKKHSFENAFGTSTETHPQSSSANTNYYLSSVITHNVFVSINHRNRLSSLHSQVLQ